MYFFRSFYSKEFCTTFFGEHLDHLSAEQSFNLLTENILPFDEKCWAKFISTLEKQDAARKAQPGMRTFPDWLIVTIEECMILKLLGFDIDLTSLEPYAHYSEHLAFMVNPEAFDYSQVNTCLLYTSTFEKNSGWNIAFQPLFKMWGTRGAGSQLSYTPNFCLLYTSRPPS